MKLLPSNVRNKAFTLIELLLGVVIGGVALAFAANVLVGQIRVTRNFYNSGQVRQDLARLHYFLLAETGEACAFQRGTRTTSPMTSCGGTCVQSGNELQLLIPITTSVNADPAANLRTIIYRLNDNNQLLRTGPRILSSGALDTTSANDQPDTIVIDNVNTFTPKELSPDCNIVTLTVRLNVPGSTQTVAEEFILRAGSRVFN
jgi:prepilin-type N-terminal cleavage/methylation domain-containing protein